MPFDASSLNEALWTLGELLEARGLTYEVVAIGGGSLLLTGMIKRPTKDLDLVARIDGGVLLTAEPLPEPLANAVRDVAKALGLAEDWLNSGPSRGEGSLFDYGLPPGFRDRLTSTQYGALTLHVAARFDQVCFKLYAMVDQGANSKHASDLKRLAPTPDELLRAAEWARTHDPSVGFRDECRGALMWLGVKVPDDF